MENLGMNTVERLDEALAAAARLGYRVRFDWLGTCHGGACEIAGQRWIFLHLGHGPLEHLDVVREALQAVTVADDAKATEPGPNPGDRRDLRKAA